ncbi:Cyclic AMP-dependent transcription factor ATF-6 alpha [Armadillidium nasatum]|uniref:Cyclic AMP-dependent transcription factor ATF-6 alpha n=1 Tax=Armadillidium nasatum TaxID=96803 RepID=A0A5N5ST30_9CRUS|nr:Cyclic AMP-dependent transcription factor ATF-6 alpha [Armadillidium nasatum]
MKKILSWRFQSSKPIFNALLLLPSDSEICQNQVVMKTSCQNLHIILSYFLMLLAKTFLPVIGNHTVTAVLQVEVLNPCEIKEEASLEAFSESINSPSNNLWDILCGNDIKPNIKVLETPPITPPDSNSILIDSPPTSPSEASSSSGSVSPLPTTTLHPSTAVITVTSDSQSPPKKKKIPLAPKIPFTVVTTITANENTPKATLTRTVNIQPKTSSISKPIASLGSSAITKLNFTRTGIDKSIKSSSKQQIRKAVVISGSQPSHSATVLSSVAIPSTINVSSCKIVPEKSPSNVSSTTRLPPLAPAINPSLKNQSLAELRAIKRQQRMIKNRESASLSRKRKKEYLQGLEMKVRELDAENSRLKAENERLQRRVTSLENEKVIMRTARFPVKRSSTALLGFVFLFLFNVSPIMNIFKGKGSDSFLNANLGSKHLFETQKIMNSGGREDNKDQYHHRSLLSFSSLDVLEGIDKDDYLAKNLSFICPLDFNSTESLRIDSELRDWFDSSSEDLSETKTKKHKVPISPKPLHSKSKSLTTVKETDQEKRALAAPITSLFSTAAYQYLYHSEKNNPSLLPNQMGEDDYFSKEAQYLGGSLRSLLQSIERRNDTYYVVSLTAEHILLPASAHNTSMRPKMSLLVPTPKKWNHPNEIGLMQIDCDVTKTRVIRWEQRENEVSVPSVSDNEIFPDSSVNGTDTNSFHRERPKKRKRRKVY